MLSFKICGMPVKVSFLFVATITIFLITDRTGIAVLSVLACLMHETGHILAFFAVGYKPNELLFEFLGIRLVKPQFMLRPKKEFIVQAAGCVVNTVVFVAIYFFFKENEKAYIFAIINLLLGIFQMFPLKNLDGGKILKLALCYIFREDTAEHICIVVDVIFMIILLCFCTLLFITQNGSITMLVFTGGIGMELFTNILKRDRKKSGN